MSEYNKFENEKITKLTKANNRLIVLICLMSIFYALDFYLTYQAASGYKAEIEQLQKDKQMLASKLEAYESATAK